MRHVSLSPARACLLVLALGSATASCTFSPSGQASDPDGSTGPAPDADPQRPDADPTMPDARPADARVDGPDARVTPDARPAEGCESWTPRPTYFDPCDLPAPLGALDLRIDGDYVYDTDTATLRAPNGNEIAHARMEIAGTPSVVAISVDSLRVGNTTRLRGIGQKPLLGAFLALIIGVVMLRWVRGGTR